MYKRGPLTKGTQMIILKIKHHNSVSSLQLIKDIQVGSSFLFYNLGIKGIKFIYIQGKVGK